jgi:hypothetical protein
MIGEELEAIWEMSDITDDLAIKLKATKTGLLIAAKVESVNDGKFCGLFQSI